jgi:broad specificity phosphatase PhoE
MALQVLGLRHGEVENPGGVIYSGLPGFFLSERGRGEAAAIAEALRDVRVTALYASPLDRAQETASYLAAVTGVEVVTDERLVEWRHWEQWAGLTWEELATKAKPAWDAYTTDPGSVTSGESLAELAGRMESWLTDVERDHAAKDTRAVVIGVTHLEPLRAILLHKLGRPATDLFSVEIGHCGVVRLAPEPDTDTIQVGHLARTLSP